MNPAAKVFTLQELEFIAGLLEKYDAYAICDEVYEHLVYDGQQHIPLMTLPVCGSVVSASVQPVRHFFHDRLEGGLILWARVTLSPQQPRLISF